MVAIFRYLFQCLTRPFRERGIPISPVRNIALDVATAASQAERECADFIDNHLSRRCGAPDVQPEKLDYSLDSLQFVDEWLIGILTRHSPAVERREIHDLACFGIRDGQALIKSVGAYCGEVIRRMQGDKWHWRTYGGFLVDPNFADEARDFAMPPSDPLIDLVLTGSK